MTETPRFEPIYPAHAIERCSATVGFGEPITEKLLQKIRTKAGPLFSQLQMGAQVQSQLSFEIDPQSGVATPKQSGFGAIVYSNMDRSLNCIITPMALVWNNARYVRWQPFIGQMEQTIPPLLSIINDAVNITNVKLEYLDRFYWTGDWDNFDSKKLLRSDRGSWAETANRGRREWHSHAGWFETISENSRRLMNINIDAVSATPPGETKISPSICILTLIQDQIIAKDDGDNLGGEDGFTDTISQLDKQHVALKGILSEVIVPEMANRITLNPPSQ